MAMPSSGCIALRTCITGCACSSISCAVAGVACSPACLSTLSVAAGKTSPHSMSEFYSYVPTPTTFTVGMSTYCEIYSPDVCICGYAYLRCCSGISVCCKLINQISDNICSWSWTNVSGCLYVDMGNILVRCYGGTIYPSDVCWSDSLLNNDYGDTTSCFSSANNICFTYSDGMYS